MTENQCKTCLKPTLHCQDELFKHLMNASCLDHTPVGLGEIPFLSKLSEHAPFEQLEIESHDKDHVDSLLHMDCCGCPVCLRMVRRGYRKIEYNWIMVDE